MDPLTTHDVAFGTSSGRVSGNGSGNGDNGNGNGYRTSMRTGMAPSLTSGISVGAPLVHESPTSLPVGDAVGREATHTADHFFWDDEPAQAMSRLSVKVETAEQLLALPADERTDMAAFLPPAELVAAFRATHDADLKKAVIDTLEHIGSPVSLNALGNCFEDTDSDIQTYALAAADRLLGVA